MVKERVASLPLLPFSFNVFYFVLLLNTYNIFEIECWLSSINNMNINRKTNTNSFISCICYNDNNRILANNDIIEDNSFGEEDANEDYYKEYRDKLFAPYHVSYNIIKSLVQQRSQARREKNYTHADFILHQLESLSSPENNGNVIRPGYKIFLKDIASHQGGGTTWDILPTVPLLLSSKHPPPKDNIDSSAKGEKESCTVLQLAHMALGLAIIASNGSATSSNTTSAIRNEQSRNSLLERAERRLIETQGTDLYGRAAADAAFWFSLSYNNPADATSNTENNNNYNILYDRLFEYLVHIATNELLRYGSRPSCAPKNILHIVERFAAAGLTQRQSASVKRLHNVAADCLESKIDSTTVESSSTIGNSNYGKTIKSLRDGTFDLHSERSLLLIWKFSTKQRKQRSFADSAVRHATTYLNSTKTTTLIRTSEPPSHTAGEAIFLRQQSLFSVSMWYTYFDDPNKPLVIDIGCGMGVSILGLSTLASTSHNAPSLTNIAKSSFLKFDEDYWTDCNFAGVDLSQLAIGYANGVAHRWGVRKKKVNFFVSSAEDFFNQIVDSYPGKVKLVLIQFPTPFRFSPIEKGGTAKTGKNDDIALPELYGNSQLPLNDSNDGFMITKSLLMLISAALKESRGHLLLQSNCEDVAVAVRKVAIQEAGFQCVNLSDISGSIRHGGGPGRKRTPQRTERYILEGGERAEGSGWSRFPLLPGRGSTETEIACEFNGTPIHRCLLTPLNT